MMLGSSLFQLGQNCHKLWFITGNGEMSETRVNKLKSFYFVEGFCEIEALDKMCTRAVGVTA